MILLANEVVVFLFVEAVLLGVLTIALFWTFPVLRRWDFSASSSDQFGLEKRAHLVVLIIVYALTFKLLLLPFFSHLINALATLVPGAMCGAGVIHSNAYGMPLLLLKVIVLAVAGLWLIINREDLRAPDYRHLVSKLRLFLLIYFLVLVESVLDVLYLTNIPTLTPVQFCSIIYGVAGPASELPLGLDTRTLLLLLVLVFSLVLVLAAARYGLPNLIANTAFLYFGYIGVVHFFGTYIYELPTHQCPFCMLQREYYFYGYLVWGTLLLGVFFGLAGFPLRLILGRDVKFTYTWNMIFLVAFVLFCVLPVGLYYARNGVML